LSIFFVKLSTLPCEIHKKNFSLQHKTMSEMLLTQQV